LASVFELEDQPEDPAKQWASHLFLPNTYLLYSGEVQPFGILLEGEIMRNAIIYCRLAAADQESDMKLETQKRDCLQYARKHDYQILEVISEVASGINPNRNGLQRLLDLCANNKIDAILVHCLQVKVYYPLSRPIFGDFVAKMAFESPIICERDVAFHRFDRIYMASKWA